MDVAFGYAALEDTLTQIMAFQQDASTAFWAEPLYHFYPQLDRDRARRLPLAQRRAYIAETLGALYPALAPLLREKAAAYGARWQACRGQITHALSDAFETDCAALFNDLRCLVSMNPIEPRFLQARRFDVFYLNSPQGALGQCIHELIHFVWFHVWQGLFQDDPQGYEAPALPWILSEMVVESVMRDPRLSELNPYFPREAGGCVYPYFFDLRLEGVPALETLDAMYRQLPIAAFMRESYAYCQRHEGAIRAHIAQAEGAPAP